MGLTEEGLSKFPNFPWEETYTLLKHSDPRRCGYRRFGRPGGSGYVETYEATYEPVEDSHHCYWRPGDIIQFDVGYNSWKVYKNQWWRSWFMPWEDYLQFLHENVPRNLKVPLYARAEFAIVMSRYRWTKHKDYGTYRDYGCIVMMLTGRRKGHTRRYYSSFPYYRISSFPYTGIAETRWNKSLDEIKYVFDLKSKVCKQNTKRAKRFFLETLYLKLGGDYEPRRSDETL